MEHEPLKRPCKYCQEIFQGSTSKVRVCDNCKEKIICLTTLKKLKKSLDHLLSKNGNFSNQKWFKLIMGSYNNIEITIRLLKNELKRK